MREPKRCRRWAHGWGQVHIQDDDYEVWYELCVTCGATRRARIVDHSMLRIIAEREARR